MSREDARREVRRAVEAAGSQKDFIEKTGLSNKTVSAFLNGKRWAHSDTRRTIEETLGWPVGRIADLAEGYDPTKTTIELEDDAQVTVVLPTEGLTEAQREAMQAAVEAVAKELRKAYGL